MTAPELPESHSSNWPNINVSIFGAYGTRRFFVTGIVVLAITYLVFFAFPGLDLASSYLFYSATACSDIDPCSGFPAANNFEFQQLRLALYGLPYLVLVGAMLYKIAVFVKNKIAFWKDAVLAAVLVATLIIGPGLLVNIILKSHIGRVRPRDVAAFGGNFPFVPVGQIEGMCKANCSFVSGEAALAPIMILSILLFPKTWQRPALFILLPASLAMALLRVVMGAHFLSDVILGYGLTLTVFSALALICIRFTQSYAFTGR